MAEAVDDTTLSLEFPDILIVDDTPTNLELLAGMLTKRNFRVRLANSGKRAIAAAQAKRPDLIMLDINMPHMDGYEVCRQLKADPATVETPVIFLSALDEVIDKVKAFNVGGADYVTKPFEFGEVLVRIENQLKIAHLQREMTRKHLELARKNNELLRSQEREAEMFSALSDLLPGTVLDGRYRLEDKIGVGGFGAVYRATQLALNRAVAVKVLQPLTRRRGPAELQQFTQEGMAACRVNHPNAVAVFDAGVSPGGVAYLVMELLQGRSLAAELRSESRLTPARSVAVAAPVCRVLAKAHEVGIVHRDIKPENVFLHRVDDDEVVKVVDFGIAKLVRGDGEDTTEDLSQNVVVGTVQYLAPERLTQQGYDGRADIYSLGVMLYRMLTGTMPFEAVDLREWLAAVASPVISPRPLRALNPKVPSALETAVLRAMAKTPAERPTAPQLEDMLVNALPAA